MWGEGWVLPNARNFSPTFYKHPLPLSLLNSIMQLLNMSSLRRRLSKRNCSTPLIYNIFAFDPTELFMGVDSASLSGVGNYQTVCVWVRGGGWSGSRWVWELMQMNVNIVDTIVYILLSRTFDYLIFTISYPEIFYLSGIFSFFSFHNIDYILEITTFYNELSTLYVYQNFKWRFFWKFYFFNFDLLSLQYKF